MTCLKCMLRNKCVYRRRAKRFRRVVLTEEKKWIKQTKLGTLAVLLDQVAEKRRKEQRDTPTHSPLIHRRSLSIDITFKVIASSCSVCIIFKTWFRVLFVFLPSRAAAASPKPQLPLPIAKARQKKCLDTDATQRNLPLRHFARHATLGKSANKIHHSTFTPFPFATFAFAHQNSNNMKTTFFFPSMQWITKTKNYFIMRSWIKFVEARDYVGYVEPRFAIGRNLMKNIIPEQFEHVTVAGFRPCRFHIELRPFVDCCKLHQQLEQPAVLQFFRQLVLQNVRANLRRVQLRVKSSADHWHQVRHRPTRLIWQQIPVTTQCLDSFVRDSTWTHRVALTW